MKPLLERFRKMVAELGKDHMVRHLESEAECVMTDESMNFQLRSN